MKKTAQTRSSKRFTFDSYQSEVEQTDEKKRVIVSLLGLVGEIGDLHSIFKKALANNRYPTFRQELTEELGDILWYVSSLATRHQLSLSEIANANLLKARQFFDAGEDKKFDSIYPEDEKFPRTFSVTFIEKKVGKSFQVKIKINDVFVGDVLDDNAHDDDGYRFHDVFHLAYAAILGWSPVVRSLLRRKRKSQEKIDRIEDGARAIFLEEAIAVFIFNQAEERNYYKEINSIDIGLLKTIKKLSENLEVKVCSAKQWQQAIFQGYAVFNLLKHHHGGVVNVDLDAKSISYLSSPSNNISGTKNVRRSSTNLPGSVETRNSKNLRGKRGNI